MCVRTDVYPEHLLLAADNKCELKSKKINKKIPSGPAEHLRQTEERGAVTRLGR